MGIDVYLRWPEQSEDEREAQFTGFDIAAGKVGYLREAYHGDPYATIWLMPEAFALDDYQDAQRGFGGGPGSLQTMLETITEALGGWEVGSTAVASPAELAPSCDGFPAEGYLVECDLPAITDPKYPDEEGSICAAIPVAVLERRLPLVQELNARRYKDYPKDVQAVQASYAAFVALYRRLEDEGRKPAVYASW